MILLSEGWVSSGSKDFCFKHLHEMYYTNASGRDLRVVIPPAIFLKEKYLFPD